ncbi:MAG: hypothetical protein CSA24_00360 [Deltaproteobacteria bacterium]|nr:MAG: hypothetical protein CSB49_03040 [Pseudomonadota bacterium]PIE66348.1 MAG: hypothetical protein CSA24_00360 [Deltaproteobacteria bacterium]
MVNRSPRCACCVLLFTLALAGCPGPPKPRPRPVGELTIQCEPKTAEVFVDDRYQGTVAALRGRPLTLLVGSRRIELRQEGYFSSFHDVKIVRGVRQTISVVLRREPF